MPWRWCRCPRRASCHKPCLEWSKGSRKPRRFFRSCAATEDSFSASGPLAIVAAAVLTSGLHAQEPTTCDPGVGTRKRVGQNDQRQEDSDRAHYCSPRLPGEDAFTVLSVLHETCYCKTCYSSRRCPVARRIDTALNRPLNCTVMRNNGESQAQLFLVDIPFPVLPFTLMHRCIMR